MTALSVLDLMMIGEDKTFAHTLDEAVALARHVETHGYKRYWIAEHHDLPGIASSATSLLIQHLAANTTTLRVGAGGIMLPNHSPLTVAEHFGTLDTLFPGRIDLGIGRAPGSAGPAIRALRGDASERDFTQDIRQLTDYLADEGRQPVRAIPGKHNVPLWLLGSSLNSAELAAKSGLPYAFASHFAPHNLMDAIAYYRNNFRPSATLQQPYVIVGANVFAAPTRAEGEYLASSHRQWVSRLYAGKPGPLPHPEEGYMERLTERDRYSLAQAMACTAVGDQDDVGSWLRQFIDTTQADEVIIDARIYDPQARCRSYQLAAESIADLLD
ncbi:LLM class flavin-dependent oxidoreductase [Pseudomonas sp. TNT11]|uniref:LLM class flavin-dependent oxidoreductase n=1 Tax=Pseudomonas emilianonis TaxID=2915812 RepID=A0ABT0EEU3_9PSED|nr:LLM class flavin-dependent oxidoreductase [Pseudomonas emilianonis]MCK1784228.1 LLM class flavin-dependent oxidoreductase [Pseudomonas emilianonis]